MIASSSVRVRLHIRHRKSINPAARLTWPGDTSWGRAAGPRVLLGGGRSFHLSTAREVRPWPPIRSPASKSSAARSTACSATATPPRPELVVAIVHAASSDWAARVICDALEDIAGALVEGGVALPGNAGLVAARSTLVRP
jgi:hypothetical protein